MNKPLEPLGLYVHIPFCVRKCAYCDFLSSSATDYQSYSQALIREIGLQAMVLREKYQLPVAVDTLFFGGGTPSLLPPSLIEAVMVTLESCFEILPEAEISIEINPGTLTKQKAETYRRIGINRASLGLQSIHEDELRALGRIHDYAMFEQSYDLLRRVGFKNINVDLMFGIPLQTGQRLKQSLDAVIGREPEHLSVYSLIVEEGTAFYRQRAKGHLSLPSEESERQMYWQVRDYLAMAGYAQYEISNYARPNLACRHNLKYWSDNDYLGLGLGAASYLDGYRLKNEANLKRYLSWAEQLADLKTLVKVTDLPNEQHHLEEVLFLGLRKRQGIAIKWLNQRFDKPLEKVYQAEIAEFIGEGMMTMTDGYIRLTDKGINYSNQLFLRFLR